VIIVSDYGVILPRDSQLASNRLPVVFGSVLELLRSSLMQHLERSDLCGDASLVSDGLSAFGKDIRQLDFFIQSAAYVLRCTLT
jgi:hypothetical protein